MYISIQPLAMARSSAAVLLVSLALAAVVAALLAASPAEAITCGQVSSALGPCLPYVSGKVTVVPAACCTGVKNLNNAAKTTPDRRMVCKCLHSLLTSSNAGKASSIPGNCGVNIGYPISPSTDCSKIQ
ncbi:non-specific lipid-transfer protein 1-like [Zingiber officinale]|uniref:non-specific lipid-transfer protein 1-like n=1 Tax=Zingiber officinale TaxID=94328 RepID=UPI001C4B63AF|nr:non-specific lipid-transfer protein 1-like [Zingiber officinale]